MCEKYAHWSVAHTCWLVLLSRISVVISWCIYFLWWKQNLYSLWRLLLKVIKIYRNFADLNQSAKCIIHRTLYFSFCIFRRNHEQTSSKIHGIHLQSARRSFDLLNGMKHKAIVTKVNLCNFKDTIIIFPCLE